MIRNLKCRLSRNITNARGWRTNQRIIVFESDDWGSIRTSSKESLSKLKQFGIQVENCPYMMNDALASNEDMQFLLEILDSKTLIDKNRKPILTANCLTANPDFEKIKASNFEKFFYESIEESFDNYPRHNKVMDLWKEGGEKELFKPQLHGREHLNISRWMRDLKNGVKDTKYAFELNMFGVSGHVALVKRGSYQAALDGERKEVRFSRTEIIDEAIEQFKGLFGYLPKTFIAPNYIWDDEIEKTLCNSGVDWIQGTNTQILPRDFGEPLKTKRHFLGQKNKYGSRYLIRNCFFEPTSDPNRDWVSSCLKEIDIAFKWKKPAIISTHRVNFVGYINIKNRDENLKLFNKLLNEILKKWPDTKFMSSDELAIQIENNG